MRPPPLLVLLALGIFLALLWEGPLPEAPHADRVPRPTAAAGTGEEPLEGAVARVHDGDTVTLSGSFGRVRVRLGQIDAPELGQPWGDRAQDALERMTLGRAARLEVSDVDDYGRRVGDLFVGEVHVNAALVREGHAWAYRRWVRDREIVHLEEAARREARGLWSLAPGEREPPWEWRRAHPRR